MKKIVSLFFLCSVVLANAQVTDIEGHVYKTIPDEYGGSWMAQNLDVGKFRNGDPIRECKNLTEWRDAGLNGEPAWCYYEFNATEGKKYGKLYNWFAIVDSRGLAPEGWKVPNEDDYKKLAQEDKNEKTYGGELIAFLNSSDTWTIDCAKGDNGSGFNGLASGMLSYNSSDNTFYFEGKGRQTAWWVHNRYVNNYKHAEPHVLNIYTKIGKSEFDSESGTRKKVEDDVCKIRFLPNRFVLDAPIYAYNAYPVRCVKPANFKPLPELSRKVFRAPYVGDSIVLNGMFNTHYDSLKISSLVYRSKTYLRVFDVVANKYTFFHSFTTHADTKQTLNQGFPVKKGIFAAYDSHTFVLYDYVNNKAIERLSPNTPNTVFETALYFDGIIYLYTNNKTSGEITLYLIHAETGKIEETINYDKYNIQTHSISGLYMTPKGHVIMLKKGVSDTKLNEIKVYTFVKGQRTQGKTTMAELFTLPIPENFPKDIILARDNSYGMPVLLYVNTINEYKSVIQTLNLSKAGDNYVPETYPKLKEANALYTLGKKVWYAGDNAKQESDYFIKSDYLLGDVIKSNSGDFMVKGYYSSVNEQSLPLYYKLNVQDKIKEDMNKSTFVRYIGVFKYKETNYMLSEWAIKDKPRCFHYFMIQL